MMRVCSTKNLKFRAIILSEDYLSKVDISVKKKHIASLIFLCAHSILQLSSFRISTWSSTCAQIILIFLNYNNTYFRVGSKFYIYSSFTLKLGPKYFRSSRFQILMIGSKNYFIELI